MRVRQQRAAMYGIGSSWTKRVYMSMKPPSVTTDHYAKFTLDRQVLWNVCCQSCEEHRFDCGESVTRGRGPVLRSKR